MDDHRDIRFLEPARGDLPCTKSRGNWRLLVDDLCVCQACDEPATTCSDKLGAYGKLPPFYARALVANDISYLPAYPAVVLIPAPAEYVNRVFGRASIP